MSGTREENVFMARLAEQAERYEDMVEYMKRVAVMGQELSLEERNLLSVAFKNSIGTRRTAWRQITMMMEGQDIAHAGPDVVQHVINYKKRVEAELDAKCVDILNILDSHLINQASGEVKVFYMKMKGDYHRYMAEFKQGEMLAQCVAQAQAAYEAALASAKEVLGPAHPIRLGLALNFSVFYNEVMSNPSAAIPLARATCSEAEAGLGSLDEDQAADASQILQLLQDNLLLWTTTAGGDKAPEQDGTAVEDF